MIRAFRLPLSLLLVFVLFLAQAQAASVPALWLARGPKAKVYLFGTIHIMKPDVAWTTPAIDQALTTSDDLWLEIPDDLRDPSSIMSAIKDLGMDPAHPLVCRVDGERFTGDQIRLLGRERRGCHVACADDGCGKTGQRL